MTQPISSEAKEVCKKAIRARRLYFAFRENGRFISTGYTKAQCGYSDARLHAVLDISQPDAIFETALEGYYACAGGFMGGIKGALVKLGIVTKKQADAHSFAQPQHPPQARQEPKRAKRKVK